MIKFFKKKTGKSEKLVISTREILALHGVIDKKTQDECAHCFFKSNAEVMKAVMHKKNLDLILNREMENMSAGLIKAGITDRQIQEELIIKYYEIICELAGVK